MKSLVFILLIVSSVAHGKDSSCKSTLILMDDIADNLERNGKKMGQGGLDWFNKALDGGCQPECTEEQLMSFKRLTEPTVSDGGVRKAIGKRPPLSPEDAENPMIVRADKLEEETVQALEQNGYQAYLDPKTLARTQNAYQRMRQKEGVSLDRRPDLMIGKSPDTAQIFDIYSPSASRMDGLMSGIESKVAAGHRQTRRIVLNLNDVDGIRKGNFTVEDIRTELRKRWLDAIKQNSDMGVDQVLAVVQRNGQNVVESLFP